MNKKPEVKEGSSAAGGGKRLLAFGCMALVVGVLGFFAGKGSSVVTPLRENESLPDLSKSKHMPGRWGDLWVTPIRISINPDVVSDMGVVPVTWTVKGVDWASIEAKLREFGLSSAGVLQSQSRVEGAFTVISPDPSFILKIDRSTRSRLYASLVKEGENTALEYPFLIRKEDAGNRFSRLSVEARKMIDAVLYESAVSTGNLLLSDLPTVLAHINPDERGSVIQAVSEQETMLITLRIDASTDLAEVDRYWGTANVTRDYLPLLRSVQNSTSSYNLDVTHLLPRFVKGVAYTYASQTMPNPEVPKDCFWTAMNFGRTQTDFTLDGTKIPALLKEEYRVLVPTEPLKLGDLLIYFLPGGESVHVAVYIAADIVFTRNGDTLLSPWIFQRKKALEDNYPRILPNSYAVYRRKAE
jgi:hypothetical protein